MMVGCPSCPRWRRWPRSSARTPSATCSRGSTSPRVQAIKTFDPPLSALGGLEITGASRHGKFLDLDVSGLHLVVHLARAGWLHWRTACRPRRRSRARARSRCACTWTTATASTSPSRAPARGWRSTSSGRRRRCPASPGSARTRCEVDREQFAALLAGRARAAQGRAHRPDADRRHRQRLLRRDPARRAALAVQDGRQARRRRTGPSLRRDAGDADRRARAPASGQKAATMKGEKRSGLRCTPAPACRARSAATPSARCLRRHLAAVLPDLPDRRQAAGRPADVQAAAVRPAGHVRPVQRADRLAHRRAPRMLGRIAAERGWAIDGERLYDEWDRRNKASQRDEPAWIPFAEHCRRSLAATYADLGLAGPRGRRRRDAARLGRRLAAVARRRRRAAGARRRGTGSACSPTWTTTSSPARRWPRWSPTTPSSPRSGCAPTSPRPELYRRARERAGGELVHVATSARDVRGRAGGRHRRDPPAPARARPRPGRAGARPVGRGPDGAGPAPGLSESPVSGRQSRIAVVTAVCSVRTPPMTSASR